jgi:hypothetical protein
LQSPENYYTEMHSTPIADTGSAGFFRPYPPCRAECLFSLNFMNVKAVTRARQRRAPQLFLVLARLWRTSDYGLNVVAAKPDALTTPRHDELGNVSIHSTKRGAVMELFVLVSAVMYLGMAAIIVVLNRRATDNWVQSVDRHAARRGLSRDESLVRREIRAEAVKVDDRKAAGPIRLAA